MMKSSGCSMSDESPINDGISLYLAEPRGFCAGVRRATGLVEETLATYGAPVYVRHEIVHNKHVIADLEKKGAVFIEELDQASPDRPLVFSAHGVSRTVAEEAGSLSFNIIDATCPLVAKVHQQVRKYSQSGAEIIVIGKKRHPEVVGTVGQAENPQRVHVICTPEEATSLNLPANIPVAVVTQTTLSTDDTAEILDILHRRFPQLKGMPKGDICYATTNRQKAVRELAALCSTVIILGSQNSSNSKQLKETALKYGAKEAFLIDDASELDWDKIGAGQRIGISAGASAPEYLVEELIGCFRKRYNKINIHHVIVHKENVNFKM